MKKAINTLRKIYLWLCKAEEVTCGIGFILLVSLVFLSAILRFMRVSVSWNLDLSMLLLAWTAFLGADVAWRSGQIIGVNLLTRNLPKTLQQVISIFTDLIILIALILIVYFGIKLSWSERLAKYQSMAIPYSLVTISLVVASFSMIFTTIQKIQIIILEMSGKDSLKILITDDKVK